MAVDAARPKVTDGSGSWVTTTLVALLAASLAGLPELLRPGHYFQDDMQSQYVPLFRELGRSWAHGELPLLTDGTWAGGALAGEYQHGVFSLFHVGLALIAHAVSAGPSAIAFGLTATYVGVTAAGAHRLALHHRVGEGLALCVALAASLNGFNVHFGSWLPALTGFAWLPWACWGVARTLEGDARARPWLCFFVYGLLSAGWHFAALMLALWLAYVLVFEPGKRGRFAAALALAPPLAFGALLAAPSLLCFVELAAASARRDLSAPSWAWTVPPSALVDLLLPRAVGEWSVFGSPTEWTSVVMSGGSLPLLLLPAAWARSSSEQRRTLAPLLLFSAVVLLLAATPNLTAARWPFRWLPLFHLSLTLAVARAVAPWARAPLSSRRALVSPLTLAAPLLLLVLATQQGSLSLLLNAAVVATGAAALTWAEKTPRRLPALLAVGAASSLVFTPLSGPPRDILPRWDTQACFRDAPGRGQRHLGVFGIRQIVGERRFPDERKLSPGSCFFPGDSGLLSERPTASGYSLLFGSGVGQVLEFGVHGELGARQIQRVAGAWSEPGSLLDRWGLEVLLVPSFWEQGVRALLAQGWRVESRERQVLLLMRPPELRAPVPLVSEFRPARVVRDVAEAREWLLRSDGHHPVYVTDSTPQGTAGSTTPASLELISATQARVTARVTVASGPGPALVRLLRPYLPGQRATLNGAPLRLGRADGAFVVAEVPAGSRGELRFDYQPLGVRAPGVVALALGLVGLGWLALRAQREQKPS